MLISWRLRTWCQLGLLSLVVGSGLAGCGGGAAVSTSQRVGDTPLPSLAAIVVLPCGARVAAQRDPDDIAPGMATSFWQVGVQRAGIPAARLVSATELNQMALSDDLARFYAQWLQHPERGDGHLLQRTALRLQADALLVAGVHRWRQDDAGTQVGMLAGLFDAQGDMLWWAEQVRNLPTRDAAVRPPDYAEGVQQVVAALIDTLPVAAAH
jgi:hypothetical protein